MNSWGPFSVAGKRVIVTGAAKGIGFGIARRFSEGGADVLLTDVDDGALEVAVGRLAGGDGKIDQLAADVATEDAGELMVRRCCDSFGGLDVLVNNAGIFPQVSALEMTAASLDRVLAVNLRGLILTSTAAGRHWRDAPARGCVVNIASIDALHPSMVGLAAYDASKGGVLMFTRSFALEMAPLGVRVNAIAPGGIHTEGTAHPLQDSGMSEAQFAEMMAAFTAQIPLNRMGEPDDIAGVAVFLASEAARYMTGALIVVDGGRLLR